MLLAPAAARAQSAPFDENVAFAIGAAALLLPAEIGVAVPAVHPSNADFVLAWSWQLPVSKAFGDHSTHHRVVGGVDLLTHLQGVSWRGRFGYRYGGDYLFGGAGVGIDGAGASLSPEIGVKFAQGHRHVSDDDPSMHLVARAEIAPASAPIRGGTLLLGWNLF